MPNGLLQDLLHRLGLLIGVDRGRHTLSMVANASCLPSRLLGPVCFLYDSTLIAIGAYMIVALSDVAEERRLRACLYSAVRCWVGLLDHCFRCRRDLVMCLFCFGDEGGCMSRFNTSLNLNPA